MTSDDRLTNSASVPGVPPSDDKARRLSAKRINESLKHFNAFANAIGAGVLATAVIIPFVKDHAGVLDADGLQWCAIGILFHALAYMVVFLFLQSEAMTPTELLWGLLAAFAVGSLIFFGLLRWSFQRRHGLVRDAAPASERRAAGR